MTNTDLSNLEVQSRVVTFDTVKGTTICCFITNPKTHQSYEATLADFRVSPQLDAGFNASSPSKPGYSRHNHLSPRLAQFPS